MKFDKLGVEEKPQVKPFLLVLLVNAILWIAIVLVVTALVCCVANSRSESFDPNRLFQPLYEQPVDPADALAPRVTQRLQMLLDSSPMLLAPGVRSFPGPTSCYPANGINPFMVSYQPGPAVGQEYTIVCWTRALPIADDTSMVWMIVGHEPFTPVDFTSFGMPGCWLLVKPDDFIHMPVGATGVVTRPASTPGRMTLRWTPTIDTYGQKLWLQLLVEAPGENDAGLLASWAYELFIGDPNFYNQPLVGGTHYNGETIPAPQVQPALNGNH